MDMESKEQGTSGIKIKQKILYIPPASTMYKIHQMYNINYTL